MNSQAWIRILPVVFITVVGFGCGTQKVLTENDNVPAGFVDADGTNERLVREASWYENE